MRVSRFSLKAPGAAYFKDFPKARLVTLSRPGALNTMTVAMLRDLYTIYVKQPHADPTAIYVVRGEGSKSFCAGGDILALSDRTDSTYRDEFYAREYEIDLGIATSPRTQVALWRGHVMGSGVGLSLHGSHRVACETTDFAMPETQIGAAPDVASVWRFGRLPVPSLGAYMAITGNTLRGADVLHAGLATHYVPLAAMQALEERLLAVRRAAEVTPLLEAAHDAAAASRAPFSLFAELPTIAETFAIRPDTTLDGIMRALKRNGSPFALATLAVMERNSPRGMTIALHNLRGQWQRFGAGDVAKAFLTDLGVIKDGDLLSDFTIGSQALLVRRQRDRPLWKPNTLAEVDDAAVRAALDSIMTKCASATKAALKGKGDLPVS